MAEDNRTPDSSLADQAGSIETLLEQNRSEEALLLIDAALTQDPASGSTYHQLGRALAALGKTEQALDAFTTACFFAQDPSESLCRIGDLHTRLRNFEEAVSAYKQALALRPSDGLLHSALAFALCEHGSLEKARQAAEEACRLAPHQAQPFHVLGAIAVHQGLLEESGRWFQRAITLAPDHAAAHTGLGITRLMRGDWDATTWVEYEWRFRREPFASPPETLAQLPRWDGDPWVARVLIWGEQGIGDMIFSLGFLQELGLRPAQMLLCYEERLIQLCQRSFPGVDVTNAWPLSTEEAGITHTLPCCSVAGLVLRSGASRHAKPFLRANPSRVQAFRTELRKDGHEVLIGLSWRSLQQKYGDQKSIALENFVALAELPGVRLVDLQYGETGQERQAFQQATGHELLHPPLDRTNDLDGLAALIAACDAVVSVSNVTAHLAGALGRPGWVLPPVRHGLLWYWSHPAGRSPWYPSLELVSAPGSGTGVEQLIIGIAQAIMQMTRG